MTNLDISAQRAGFCRACEETSPSSSGPYEELRGHPQAVSPPLARTLQEGLGESEQPGGLGPKQLRRYFEENKVFPSPQHNPVTREAAQVLFLISPQTSLARSLEVALKKK